MNYVETPNLPRKQISSVIVDNRAGEEIYALEELGINVIKSLSVDFIESPISAHPDMQICHLGYNKFACFGEVSDYYKRKFNSTTGELIDCEIFNNTHISLDNGNNLKYPYDCLLNSVVSAEWVITHTSNELYDNIGKIVIKVRQGYAKCSTCVIDDNAIITADVGIANAVESNGIDVCVVSNDTIKLEGYSNGFIGGCCGKIDKDKIVFFGDLSTHPDCNRIKSFCNKYGVECISLTSGCLKDYGSLIPIIEA